VFEFSDDTPVDWLILSLASTWWPVRNQSRPSRAASQSSSTKPHHKTAALIFSQKSKHTKQVQRIIWDISISA
jgi:hypothetical protein